MYVWSVCPSVRVPYDPSPLTHSRPHPVCAYPIVCIVSTSVERFACVCLYAVLTLCLVRVGGGGGGEGGGEGMSLSYFSLDAFHLFFMMSPLLL